MIRDAEKVKANIFPLQGGDIYSSKDFNFTARIDEEYLTLGGHIDENMQQKIIKGDYIDFGRLILRDRILMEEDGRMELTIKDGKAFWSPVSAHDSTNIGHFQRWEQAFRIYANMYTRSHPQRASELIQYNHIIHTISQTYIWDNVYAYDKDFRMHMVKYPEHNWSLILHQAWALRLKDRIRTSDNWSWASTGNSTQNLARSNNNIGASGGIAKQNKPCCRFNRGRCNFSANCKYDHRCFYCGRYGHGFFNCRKANADRDKQGKRESFTSSGRRENNFDEKSKVRKATQ